MASKFSLWSVIVLVTLTVFSVAWLAAISAWLYAVYHLLMFTVRLWHATPPSDGAVGKFFDLRLGWFRSDIPDLARRHRRRFLIGITVFCGCCVCGLLGGAIGTWLGVWQTIAGQ